MSLSTASCGLLMLAVVAVVALARYTLQLSRNPLNKIPGPWHTRLSNLRLKFAVLSGQRMYYVDSLHRRYGPFVRIAPNEVAVADATSFKQIHAVNSGFNKSQWYQDLTAFERPTVFTMLGGKPHADRRRLLSRAFSKTSLRQWEPILRDHVRFTMKRITEEAAAGDGVVNILKWFTFMASDISAQLMFGESFHTLETGAESDYIRVLGSLFQGSGIGVELPLVKSIGSYIPTQACRDMFRGGDFVMSYGREAVRRMKESVGAGNVFANMVAQAEKGEQLEDLDVQLEATALIVAGTDTTAVTLTYLVWAVLSSAAVHKALNEELEGLTEGYTDADLEALPYLTAVIDETLRLYGAAPGGLPRTVPEGGRILNGYFFPEGSTVTTQAYTLHRDPSLFPNPDSFDSSRWIKGSNTALSDAARAVYSPFGIGSRGCLGVHLAYMELRYATAEFFRTLGARATLAPSTTEQSMDMENYFLIAPVSHKSEIVIRGSHGRIDL